MSMNAKTKIRWAAGAALAFLAFCGVRAWAQSSCDELPGSFTENFDAVTYKDPHSSVALWPKGPIQLNRLGANFAVMAPTGMGAQIYVCDAGDFTGDGRPDLIGLDIAGGINRLMLVRNVFYDGNLDGVDDDGVIFTADPTEVYEQGLACGPASITVADYNGDGLLDFFFYKNRLDGYFYDSFVAAMYINVGTRTNPDFRAHNVSPSLDFSGRFQTAGIYANWAADHLCSVDIDAVGVVKDGDMDILVISQDKIFLLRNPGPENFNLDAWGISELNYDQRTGFPAGSDSQRGGSSIDAADFDNDGDVDIVGGTVMDIPYLVYYENDGLGAYTRKEIAIPVDSCTGTVATCVADFKNDGHMDIFAGTDRWNAGNEAHMWFLKNKGFVDGVDPDPGHVDWEFKCLNNCDPILPEPHDVDMSACVDFDGDGDMDVILADANHSGDYYLIINELAPVYALSGVATSTNVTEGVLDPREFAITRVQFTSLQQSVIGGSSTGLTVNFEVSNDGGQTWEPYATYTGSNIRNYSSGLPMHNFNTFGGQLKWRATLSATKDSMEEYEDASYETPAVGEIQMTYWYVERQEYSRSSASATIVDRSGQKRKLIIGSSFIFPGWEGQLRAYDVTEMGLTGGQYSTLRTVTTSDLGSSSGRTTATGVEILWDAGQILNDRASDDRDIYTVLRSGSRAPYTWTRTAFTRTNLAALPALGDYNNDNAGLVDFVRGTGRYWKLGDINHSSPVVVGPPEEDAVYMGAGYADFKQAQAGRTKVLYVGANDGMLHCFDIATGEELWAFIPNNLLTKLYKMRPRDSATGQRYFLRDVYVDGSPSVADVQIGGLWKTVLVCGQGAGWGSTGTGGNYYFALDITVPTNPVPLWEVTQTNMGETWSVPAIGKLNHSGTERWVAFMGSGYDNLPIGNVSPTTTAPVAGNRFYVVRLDNGVIINGTITNGIGSGVTVTANSNTWNTSLVMTGWKASYRYTDIVNAIPGSPTAIDSDNNGLTNSVYFGDLDGHLYRVNATGSIPASWGPLAIYTDALYYPIITKPAVWTDPLSGSTTPHIYFGTGGHDAAPAGRKYSFVEIIDTGAATMGWYIGDPTVLGNPGGQDVGDLDLGDKVWADPVISDYIIYFSTLRGNIENNNPCQNLSEPTGKLFARYIRNVIGVAVGGTAFKTSATVSPQYLQMLSKARRAVTLGERAATAGINKREVYIQEYNSTVEMLEQPVGALLRIKSWREIYKIFR
jgi:hypothetical protein